MFYNIKYQIIVIDPKVSPSLVSDNYWRIPNGAQHKNYLNHITFSILCIHLIRKKLSHLTLDWNHTKQITSTVFEDYCSTDLD